MLTCPSAPLAPGMCRAAALECVETAETAYRAVVCPGSPPGVPEGGKLQLLFKVALGDGPEGAEARRVVALHQIGLVRLQVGGPIYLVYSRWRLTGTDWCAW